jgi:hypothetical protein
VARVEIKLNRIGTGSLVLDGTDLSNAVAGLTLSSRPGGGAYLQLDLAAMDFAVEADADVTLPEDVQVALLSLGWTPPTLSKTNQED